MREYNENLALEVLNSAVSIIEPELEKIYTVDLGTAATLYEAQRYSLLSGGKRIRPAIFTKNSFFIFYFLIFCKNMPQK